MQESVKKFIIYFLAILAMVLCLSRFVICKMRWNDVRARRVFHKRNIPLQIKDTIIDGRHLHYALTGNDTLPLLVFIHGSPGSWFHYMKYMWDTALLKKFRMAAIDRPGFGFSDYGQALNLEDQSKLLLPLLQRLESGRRIFLFGHSYGAPLAAKLAAEDPSLCDKLIIASGALDPSLEEKETWRHIMEHTPLCWFLPGVFRQSNTELLYLKKDLVPLAADLSKITCDVVFIHGSRDSWVPIGNMAYGKKMMVHAASITCDTIQDGNHNIPWNKREDMKRILFGLK